MNDTSNNPLLRLETAEYTQPTDDIEATTAVGPTASDGAAAVDVISADHDDKDAAVDDDGVVNAHKEQLQSPIGSTSDQRGLPLSNHVVVAETTDGKASVTAVTASTSDEYPTEGGSNGTVVGKPQKMSNHRQKKGTQHHPRPAPQRADNNVHQPDDSSMESSSPSSPLIPYYPHRSEGLKFLPSCINEGLIMPVFEAEGEPFAVHARKIGVLGYCAMAMAAFPAIVIFSILYAMEIDNTDYSASSSSVLSSSNTTKEGHHRSRQDRFDEKQTGRLAYVVAGVMIVIFYHLIAYPYMRIKKHCPEWMATLASVGCVLCMAIIAWTTAADVRPLLISSFMLTCLLSVRGLPALAFLHFCVYILDYFHDRLRSEVFNSKDADWIQENDGEDREVITKIFDVTCGAIWPICCAMAGLLYIIKGYIKRSEEAERTIGMTMLAADQLRQFDMTQFAQTINRFRGALQSELIEAFEMIEANLATYRPHVPNFVIEVASGTFLAAESDGDEEREECSSSDPENAGGKGKRRGSKSGAKLRKQLIKLQKDKRRSTAESSEGNGTTVVEVFNQSGATTNGEKHGVVQLRRSKLANDMSAVSIEGDSVSVSVEQLPMFGVDEDDDEGSITFSSDDELGSGAASFRKSLTVLQAHRKGSHKELRVVTSTSTTPRGSLPATPDMMNRSSHRRDSPSASRLISTKAVAPFSGRSTTVQVHCLFDHQYHHHHQQGHHTVASPTNGSVGVLSDLVDAISDLCQAHRGSLQYMHGDTIHLSWNATMRVASHETKACKFMLGLQERVMDDDLLGTSGSPPLSPASAGGHQHTAAANTKQNGLKISMTGWTSHSLAQFCGTRTSLFTILGPAANGHNIIAKMAKPSTILVNKRLEDAAQFDFHFCAVGQVIHIPPPAPGVPSPHNLSGSPNQPLSPNSVFGQPQQQPGSSSSSATNRKGSVKSSPPTTIFELVAPLTLDLSSPIVPTVVQLQRKLSGGTDQSSHKVQNNQQQGHEEREWMYELQRQKDRSPFIVTEAIIQLLAQGNFDHAATLVKELPLSVTGRTSYKAVLDAVSSKQTSGVVVHSHAHI